METVMTRELKDKDLHPAGPRRAILYLGKNDRFEKKYKQLMTLLRTKYEEEKLNQKMIVNLNDEEGEIDNDPTAVDKQQVFLKQFAGMS